MAQKPLSDKTLRDTLAFYDAAHGNAVAAAKLAGVASATFAHRVRAARNKFGISATLIAPDTGVAKRAKDLSELGQLKKEVVVLREALSAQAKAPKLPKPKFRRASDEDEVWVVMPDSHGSHADPAAMAAFIGDLPALTPTRLIALGDQIDCGGFLAQHHTMGYLAQLDESAYADDLEAWRIQLDTITEAAGGPRITLLEGNHEQRLEKWAVQQTIGNRKDAEMLTRAISPQHRLDYEGRGIDYVRYGELREGVPVRGAVRIGKCYFTHGFATGPSAAQKHAQKFGAPVVYGHTPASFFGKTVHGGVQAAWCPGHLSKNAPRFMHNNPDNWGHGYAVLLVSKSGHFTYIHVPIINGVSYLPTAFRAKA
jgi:hypothetical protein